ncbi:MAG: double zinc ribbon domain-containing protein [candidate division WOR-3 bacterium]|jgi:ComF family protein
MSAGLVLSRLKYFLRAFADFVFPPVCFGCNAEIESGLLCPSCQLLLFSSELDVCVRCGRPCLPNEKVCGRCNLEFNLSRVRAVGVYQPPFTGLIHALKYHEKTALVPVLGNALALLVRQDSELNRADGICAVPLHPARTRERGYNQSYLLAREVSAITGIRLYDPLVRKKNTPSQTEMKDEQARLENVRDAFGIKPGVRFNGERLILVDDVMTTGSTISAAAAPLRTAGVGDVMGLVLAAAVVRKDKQ